MSPYMVNQWKQKQMVQKVQTVRENLVELCEEVTQTHMTEDGERGMCRSELLPIKRMLQMLRQFINKDRKEITTVALINNPRETQQNEELQEWKKVIMIE